MEKPIKRQEVKPLIENMEQILTRIPRGLSNLSDAVTFASIDLWSFFRHGIKTKDFDKALEFAQSIPVFSDYSSVEFSTWLVNDRAYLKYWPPY